MSNPARQDRTSRRDFIRAGAVGLAGSTIATIACQPASSNTANPQLTSLRSATPADLQGLVGDGRRRRILLRGGVVLSLDPKVGDFDKADVLIDGKKIVEVAPAVAAGDAEIVDCSGTIVMPGFITTHHHMYETLQRSSIPDGLLAGAWPQESRIRLSRTSDGRPHHRRGCPNNVSGSGRTRPGGLLHRELVACLSEISEGITTEPTPRNISHARSTDAMIKGLMDSGRRVVYAYTGGVNRTSEGSPYEFPGAMNDTAKGIGRIAKTYFSSKDQLVTLGFGGGPGPAAPGADFTGWQLARAFGASIHNHNVGGPGVVIKAAADGRNGNDWSDVTFIHCTRAGRSACPGQFWIAWLSEGKPIESVGDLA
jgi:hypothetical protein